MSNANREAKLDAILAKCRENLAVAERRTPGKWFGQIQDPNREFSTTVGSVDGAAVGFNLLDSNAAFIAACAGSAEAGWKSAIAAIETLSEIEGIEHDCMVNNACPACQMENLADAIIAAWIP